MGVTQLTDGSGYCFCGAMNGYCRHTGNTLTPIRVEAEERAINGNPFAAQPISRTLKIVVSASAPRRYEVVIYNAQMQKLSEAVTHSERSAIDLAVQRMFFPVVRR